jgi:hypothetical protein
VWSQESRYVTVGRKRTQCQSDFTPASLQGIVVHVSRYMLLAIFRVEVNKMREYLCGGWYVVLVNGNYGPFATTQVHSNLSETCVLQWWTVTVWWPPAITLPPVSMSKKKFTILFGPKDSSSMTL